MADSINVDVRKIDPELLERLKSIIDEIKAKSPNALGNNSESQKHEIDLQGKFEGLYEWIREIDLDNELDRILLSLIHKVIDSCNNDCTKLADKLNRDLNLMEVGEIVTSVFINMTEKLKSDRQDIVDHIKNCSDCKEQFPDVYSQLVPESVN